MTTNLDYVLRAARYARNSDDATRGVRHQSPMMIASDWAPAVECARALIAERVARDSDFSSDDVFNIHFLAGYAVQCGRPEYFEPLSELATMMRASFAAAATKAA